jgi:hypothetical protein
MKSDISTWCTLTCVPFAAAAADSSLWSRRLRVQYAAPRNVMVVVVVVVVHLLRHWRCGSLADRPIKQGERQEGTLMYTDTDSDANVGGNCQSSQKVKEWSTSMSLGYVAKTSRDAPGNFGRTHGRVSPGR